MKRWQTLSSFDVTQDPAGALILWLNQPGEPGTLVGGLVRDARCVMDVLAEFSTLKELMTAHKKGKLPDGFWDAYEQLNETLRHFEHAPQIDANSFYEGVSVNWTITGNAPPLGLVSLQLKCVLQLISQGTITKIHQCEDCREWYLARLRDQRFCSTSCRWNAFASNPAFKAERRAKAKERYRLHADGKVTTKKKNKMS